MKAEEPKFGGKLDPRLYKGVYKNLNLLSYKLFSWQVVFSSQRWFQSCFLTAADNLQKIVSDPMLNESKTFSSMASKPIISAGLEPVLSNKNYV